MCASLPTTPLGQEKILMLDVRVGKGINIRLCLNQGKDMKHIWLTSTPMIYLNLPSFGPVTLPSSPAECWLGHARALLLLLVTGTFSDPLRGAPSSALSPAPLLQWLCREPPK